MSCSKRGRKLDLKLNLALQPLDTLRRKVAEDEEATATSQRSCLSSEAELLSPPARTTAPMVLAGCRRCLMYVMLSQDDLRCPKCRSTVLIDFFSGSNTNNSK